MNEQCSLVSVIIPTYGHAATVLETIASVKAQTYPNIEIIVVNDGSPDHTHEVLSPLVQAGQIRYVRQENQGQSVARNRGLEKARGEYVSLLDDDDLWPPDKLVWQIQALQDNSDALLVYGGMRPFEGRGADALKDGKILSEVGPSGQVVSDFMRRNWIVSPGQTLIRTSALREIGGLDTRIWGADDYDLYLRLAKKGRFVYHHRLSLLYRKHSGNASRRIGKLYRNKRKVRKFHRSFGDLFGSAFWDGEVFMRRYYSRQYALAAEGLAADGFAGQALLAVLKGAWIWPPQLRRSFLIPFRGKGACDTIPTRMGERDTSKPTNQGES